MAAEKILVVDDDPNICLSLTDRLNAEGFETFQALTGTDCLKIIKNQKIDLVLLDLILPDKDGIQIINLLHKDNPDLPIIILTGHGTIENAVEAMKKGAYDFLLKPGNPDHILIVVQKALERKNLKIENQLLRQEVADKYAMVIGKSNDMQKIMDLIKKVAPSKTTILIQSESGTGKQLLARTIHNLSDRCNQPFIQVTCTTLSEQLLESDLFGHEKGAFTGAVKQKKGRFELADKGTLFLDEIGDLSLSIQAKLLHFLEYEEFQRVGGTTTYKVDVRIITATNKDLTNLVKEGKFREDLFYRLNVMMLQIPPLRSRPEDIPIFIKSFIQKHSCLMQKTIKGIAPNAVKILKNYSWPGNIRELDNVIERAVVLATEHKLTPDVLPPLVEGRSTEEISTGMPLEEAQLKFKKQFITKTLRFANNSQTKAAELLKIQRTYLNKLIRELNINI